MKLPIYQVDAFTNRVFAGNPAAICPLDAWLPDEVMQNIAAENNLAETAFFVKQDGGYGLRWFTPATEVDLCGHATLASAHVIFQFLEPKLETVAFQSKSGELRVTREGSRLALDFPARPPERVTPCPGLLEALGGKPLETWAARDYMILYGSEEEVRTLKPDMMALCNIDRFAVIVTAAAQTPGVDFVSRFFAPAKGVPEDPVTGSAHCTLIPYWAGQFGKTSLVARQISPRGGELVCELQGTRVKMAGEAVLYLTGTIEV